MSLVTTIAQPSFHNMRAIPALLTVFAFAATARAQETEISASREGSGTAWLPDASPMRALHARVGPWTLMLHGNIFVGADAQATDRGDTRAVSTNWIMLMGERPIGATHLALRAMLSADPWTVTEKGYPLLLQTGESYRGQPLVDRQHPHDLFMELAARLRVPLGSSATLELYGGPVGEPALGPVAFPHRPSAMADPLAPLSHHWQDSTHITFGVVTAGIVTDRFKIEASWFNGREPDEERTDFDLRGFDSVSARASLNVGAGLSLQGSYGYLDSPEQLHPDVAIHRVTASATHVAHLSPGTLSSAAIWGHNHPTEGEMTNAFLIESTFDARRLGTFFGRAEVVQKLGEDFGMPEAMADEILPVGSLVAGYFYTLPPMGRLELGIGARGSMNFVGDTLASRYGTHTPVGGMIFVRLTPAPMRHEMQPAQHEIQQAKERQTQPAHH